MNGEDAFLPIYLRLGGRRCAVVGGGRVAERRVCSLLDAGARVRLIAPEATKWLGGLADAGDIEWIRDRFSPEHIVGMFIVVCATNDESVNRSAALAARAAGALLNMAAPPAELGDFIVPGRVDSGALTLTVATGGASPELSRLLCQKLAEDFASVYGPWLERIAPIREELKSRMTDSAARKNFWRSAMSGRIMELVIEGRLDEAEAEVKDAAYLSGTES